MGPGPTPPCRPSRWAASNMSRSWPAATRCFALSAVIISGRSSWVGRCLRRPRLENHPRLNRRPASDDHETNRTCGHEAHEIWATKLTKITKKEDLFVLRELRDLLG